MAYAAISVETKDSFRDIESRLRDCRILNHAFIIACDKSDWPTIKRCTNTPSVSAKHSDRAFKAGAFVTPPNPADAQQAVLDELERLRQLVVASETEASGARQAVDTETQLRQKAEAAATAAYSELAVALELAEETEQQFAEERASAEVCCYIVTGRFKTGHEWALQNQPVFLGEIGLLIPINDTGRP